MDQDEHVVNPIPPVRAYKLYCAGCLSPYYFAAPLANEGPYVFQCKWGHQIFVPALERMVATLLSESEINS